ncbi:MAG: hypothetical protein AABY22_16765 [Nanoarchaeota archaeon]
MPINKITYKVFVEVGKGKNKATSGSIPLSKQKVCNWIKKNSIVRTNTKIRVTNINNKKMITGTQSTFCNHFGKFQKEGIE